MFKRARRLVSRNAMLRGFRALLIFLVLLLASCNEPKRLTGGASETEATIMGRVSDIDGTPTSGVTVRLRSSNYLADTSGAGTATGLDTETGNNGSFQFQRVFLGEYILEAVSSEGGASAQAVVDGNDGRVEAGNLVLQPTSTLRGRVYVPGGILGGAYVRIFGLDRSIQVDTTGAFEWNNLPPGLFDLKITPVSPALTSRSLMGVLLASGDKVDLGDIPLTTLAYSEDFSTWGDSSRFYVDTRVAGNSGTLEHFPLLLRLDKTLFDFSFSTGSDLRVTDANGKPLAYEIERWDPLEGQAELWVRYDTLRLGDSAVFLNLFWNRPGAISRSDGASVFDTADGYFGAWHLNRGQGQPALFQDASDRGNDATADGPENGPYPLGISHLGQSLDGKSQALHTSMAFQSPDTFTVSLWFKTLTNSGGKLLGFGSQQTGSSYLNDRQVWMDNSGRLHFGVFLASPGHPETGVNKVLSAKAVYNDGQWHHVAARLSAEGQYLFVDGEPVASDPESRSSSSYPGFWRIGYDNFGNWNDLPKSFWFQGIIDEPRVAHKAWSDAFIRLAYANQKPGSNLVSRRK